MRCHIKPLDCERVKREIIELAALKYSKCTYSRAPAITSEIKNILAQSTPVTEADYSLIQKAVRKILVGGSGDTEIEFKNGKRITYGGNRK